MSNYEDVSKFPLCREISIPISLFLGWISPLQQKRKWRYSFPLNVLVSTIFQILKSFVFPYTQLTFEFDIAGRSISQSNCWVCLKYNSKHYQSADATTKMYYQVLLYTYQCTVNKWQKNTFDNNFPLIRNFDRICWCIQQLKSLKSWATVLSYYSTPNRFWTGGELGLEPWKGSLTNF